jgi:hypothetical protein
VANEANIFFYCCVAGVAPAHDLHAQPPPLLTWDERDAEFIRRGRVPATCTARHWRSAVDGLRRDDNTCGPVASGDPHVPPSMWLDHDDASGHHHDPWSPY